MATFTIRVDEVSASTIYVGEAATALDESSPMWRIKKLETTGTVLKVLWADGNALFDNVWADRASLSYS